MPQRFKICIACSLMVSRSSTETTGIKNRESFDVVALSQHYIHPITISSTQR